MKALEKDDIVRPVEGFDDILVQVLAYHNLVLQSKNDPPLPICPFRDPAKPYCKYRGSLSASKECEDYCRLEFQTCPTYQEHRLSKLEKEFIDKVANECLIHGVDFNIAKRELQRCFVTMELADKKRGRDYESVKRSDSKNPLHPIRCRIINGGNSGGLVKGDSCHSGQVDS